MIGPVPNQPATEATQEDVKLQRRHHRKHVQAVEEELVPKPSTSREAKQEKSKMRSQQVQMTYFYLLIDLKRREAEDDDGADTFNEYDQGEDFRAAVGR
jgi:hypothetical protein